MSEQTNLPTCKHGQLAIGNCGECAMEGHWRAGETPAPQGPTPLEAAIERLKASNDRLDPRAYATKLEAENTRLRGLLEIAEKKIEDLETYLTKIGG